jgi:hypothetical protein
VFGVQGIPNAGYAEMACRCHTILSFISVQQVTGHSCAVHMRRGIRFM